ncbi:hypothetical protein [Hydrogenimonas sp.]
MIRKRGVAAALALVLGASSLAAEESLRELLDAYRIESDLSKKTKEENAGSVVVYTRDDLERMQIYRLTDILRELRFKGIRLNDFGMVDPVHVPPCLYNSDSIKIYVNDHEIVSSFSGSGLQFYGDVDMGMFDHVEVYYHAPVLDVATEPAVISIKLYTKDPERENGSSVVGRVGDRGTCEVQLSDARLFDEWSYYAYAEHAENRFKPTSREAGGRVYDISRDYRQQHLFFDLHRGEHRLEPEYLGQKHDHFTAQSAFLTPRGGYWEQPRLRASWSSSFL